MLLCVRDHPSKASTEFVATIPAMSPLQESAFCPPTTAPFIRRKPLLTTHRPQPVRRRRTHPVATLPTPQSQSKLPHRAPDYYANVGSVIDTLRHDVPQMLFRAPDMSIYTDTLTFSDGSGYRVSGREAYKTVLWLLRAQARLVFATACVEIQSIYHDNCEGCVYLRWRMTAHPRWSGMGTCVIDGMSVYRLDNSGWVYEHALENAARRRDRRVVFDGLSPSQTREARVVGAGVGAGGLPGWYRTVYEPPEFVRLEQQEEKEESLEELCL